jgi:NAD-dependent DNA ligase
MASAAEVEKMSVDDLVDLLKKAQDAYHNDPENLLMTDNFFDALKGRLQKLAPKHPFLKTVGAKIASADIKLPYYMGSMDKIRDDPKELEKWKGKHRGGAVCSDKLDGNSGMVVYGSDGKTHLYSRGDGVMGKDISSALAYVVVPVANASNKGFVVRGELVISKANWAGMSGSHPRNVANGALKSLDPAILKSVDFVAYELLHPKPKTPFDGLETLKAHGFNVVDHKLLSDEELSFENLSKELIARRADSKYDVDGIVVCHNADHKHPVGKNPTYAFAMKSILTHDEAEVIVEKVEWNVSKDGYIKPRVYFNPVTIDGAVIQKATGNNASFIEENKIGIGARVVIIRSGAVIPHILRVLSPAPNGPDLPPTSLGWVWNDTHVDAVLSSGTDDAASGEAVFEKLLLHFVKALNLKGIGPGVIAIIHASGVNSVVAFTKLTMKDILEMGGFQAKSAKTVHDAITSIKTAPLLNIMVASNIFGRGLGKTKLELIIAEFPDIHPNIRKPPTVAKVAAVSGIGPAASKQFGEGINKLYTFLEEIEWKGDVPPMASEPTAAQSAPTPLSPNSALAHGLHGKTVVFTGFRNGDIERAIVKNGGKVVGSVSRKTDFLVAANAQCTSGSCAKAREYDIPIMTLNQFQSEFGLN